MEFRDGVFAQRIALLAADLNPKRLCEALDSSQLGKKPVALLGNDKNPVVLVVSLNDEILLFEIRDILFHLRVAEVRFIEQMRRLDHLPVLDRSKDIPDDINAASPALHGHLRTRYSDASRSRLPISCIVSPRT